jgi:hypothetical protein
MVGVELQDVEVEGTTWSLPARHGSLFGTALGDTMWPGPRGNDEPIEMLKSDKQIPT